jgi:Bacterial pre-peptidase C-terminal domain
MRRLLLSSVSILSGVLAGQAMAQSATTPRPIAIGQTISGTIGPEDAKLSSDQSSYEIYRVQVPAGRRVTATLTTSAFQPVLGAGTNITDDCEGCSINVGETTKPAIVSRTMTSAGALDLRVNTMSAGETGAFTLAVTAIVPPPLAAQPIVYGQPKTGALTATDATSGDNNTLTDAYALRLTAGQQVQVDLSSSDFDPKLELLAPGGSKVADDDDSGPGNSARIRFTAPRAGVYQIRSMALTDGGMGAYTLRAGARPPIVPMPAPRPLVLGTAQSGVINASTPSYENDGEETVGVRYSFSATAGNIYIITATKRAGSEIDPKISVGKLVNGVIDSPVLDDDGAGELNSALRFRPTSSGVYVVEVGRAGETVGAYEVKVVQSPPDRAPGNPIAVTLGTEYKGALADGGPRRSDDTLFSGYTVALKAGQRVTVHLKKDGDSNLDPKVEIGKGTLAAFEQLAEDDDGGAELNSRIRFVAPADGTYVIRATAASASNEGRYVLQVVETPPPVIPPAPTPIQAGQALTGALATSDPLLNDSTYYDRYVLNGAVGDTYEISVSAEPYDVIVGARSALREDDDYKTDDDSGGGTNAKLTYTITTAGPQTIRITSLGEEAVGNYTISIVKK